MAADLLICIATELEGARLRERLGADSSLEIVRMGVGPVNAAHAVTLAITRSRRKSVV